MRKMKKLRLERETLRVLDAMDLAAARIGGGTGVTASCACPTTPLYSAGCPTRGGSNNSCGICYEN